MNELYRVSQQVLDGDLAKNLKKYQKTKKNRESLFTFWLSSADVRSF